MSHQKLPNGYWTDEKVIEESRKYHTKIEFKQNAPTACKLAYQRKLIDKMIWLKTDRHKKRGPRKEQKYTKDVITSFVYFCSLRGPRFLWRSVFNHIILSINFL